MKDIVILGAGGLGQEIAWLIEEINEKSLTWNLLGYLDDYPGINGSTLSGYKVLGRFSDFRKYPNAEFVVAFGDPLVRLRVVKMIEDGTVSWATLVSPTVKVSETNTLGKGVVIGRNTDLTVGCTIGDHVMLNIHVVLGHGVSIGPFSIVSPNVTVNGGASIGMACLIGSNSFIRDVTVGDFVTIGASSCVVKDVESDVVVFGVPARVIKQGPPTHSVTKSERK